MGVFFLVCEMILIFLCSLNFVLGKGNPLALVPPVVVFKLLGCASSLSLSFLQVLAIILLFFAVLHHFLFHLYISLSCVCPALTKLCRYGMCIFLLHGTSLYIQPVFIFSCSIFYNLPL